MSTRTPLLNSGWHKTEHTNGYLWLKGILSCDVEHLTRELLAGNIPSELSGNFAVIWKNGSQEIFIVDHLCSIPLFYSDEFVSPYFWKIEKMMTPKLTENTSIQKEINFLGGFSLGTETSFTEITRIPPGHYFDGQNILRYSHFPDPKIWIKSSDIQNSRDVFFSEMEKVAKRNPVLLLSSGQDSWTLFEVIQYLGLQKKFTYVHLYSRFQIFSERKYLEDYFSSHSDLDFREYDIGYSGFGSMGSERDKFFSFWKENPFAAKLRAARQLQLQGVPILTGEVGTGEFHGRKILNSGMQISKDFTGNLAKLLMASMTTFGRIWGYSDELLEKIVEEGYKETATEAQYYLRKKIEFYSNEDISWWLPLIWCEEQAAFRLFHYSQDEEFDWRHPYADYRFIKVAASKKVDASDFSIEKGFYKDFFGPILDPARVQRPKLGLSIPSYEKVKGPYVS